MRENEMKKSMDDDGRIARLEINKRLIEFKNSLLLATTPTPLKSPSRFLALSLSDVPKLKCAHTGAWPNSDQRKTKQTAHKIQRLNVVYTEVRGGGGRTAGFSP